MPSGNAAADRLGVCPDPVSGSDNDRMLFELERGRRCAAAGEPVLDARRHRLPEGVSAVVGPSGAGKSTLLRLLNRLADPDGGDDRLPRDRPLAGYDPLALRREVSLVPQLPALLEGTVESNLRYAAGLAGKRARRSTALPAASPASTPTSPTATSPSSRSASSSGRCWRGRSPSEPDVLLLDEPTSALDHAARDAIEADARRAAARARRSRSSSSATTPSRRAASATGWCGWRRGRVVDGGPLAEVLA